jgi:PAS domain S-box-containing protein
MKLRLLLLIMCLAVSIIPIAMISGLQGFQIASVFLVLILVITLMVGYIISYFISRPLVTLTKNIDEISKGNLDVELEDSEIDEINNLTASLDRVMASLKLAIHKVGLKKEDIFEEVVKAKEVAEMKFENVLKKIDGWIWEIDEKGICTVCSAKVAEALGYTPEQMIGKEVFGFLPGEEAKKLKEMIIHTQHEKTDITNKVDLFWSYNEDKHPVWIRSYLIPVFDNEGHFHGLRCFSRDITEVRIAQDQIAELHTKLESFDKQIHELLEDQLKEDRVHEPVFDVTAEQEFDYMFIFDENGKIIDCTNDIQLKLGYNKQEMLTFNISDVAYLESSEEIKTDLVAVKKQGDMQVKTIHKKKDGSSVFVSEHIKYLKDRNMFICMVKEDTL